MSGGGIKTRHGRCASCKTSYTWDGLPLLRDARCPKCKMDLRMGKYMALGSSHSVEKPLAAGQEGVQ